MRLSFLSHRLYAAALALLITLPLGCRSTAPVAPAADPLLASIQQVFAPDGRVARFDVEMTRAGSRAMLRGETTEPAALAALYDSLRVRGLDPAGEVTVLPTADVRSQPFGLVTISVANLRSQPRHSAELSTQALLGTPVRVLKEENGWLYVQTPDRYLAWTDGGAIARLDTAMLRAAEATTKIIYLPTYGFAFEAPDAASARVSDLVAGALLEMTGRMDAFYAVRFPDGRSGFVPASEAQPYDAWLAQPRASQASLVTTAQALLGVPYLWGGTSAKGMDCSGFTRTVYQLNGLLLPRDASQQIHAGVEIDREGDFSRLQPGDLLFFGRRATDTSPERVIHVGMWIGDDRFIHASGRVRVSSMNPGDPDYEAYERGRYLRTNRILGQPGGTLALGTDRGLYHLMPTP